MKLVSFIDPKDSPRIHLGLLWGKWILDIHDITRLSRQLEIPVSKRISRGAARQLTALDLLDKGQGFLDELQSISWRFFNRIDPERVPQILTKVSNVTLRPPVPRPRLLRDFYAFEDHVKTARARRGLIIPKEWYDLPAFYYSNPNVIYGPEEEVPIPSYTSALDYELEIACVLGTGGVNIPEEKAESCIAGYTIMNDWSARDIQEKEMKIGLGPAKAKDFATSLGPWLVTPDELEDRRVGDGRFDLEMKARVNGKPLSRGNMKQMHWTFPPMIARASESVELYPGEVFGSGTVGTGSILELGPKVHRYLKSGYIVELEIERLGVLRNRIIRSKKGM